MGLAIGFFGIMMSFGKSLTWKFHVLNENYRSDHNANNIKKGLCDAIRLHSTVTELSVIVVIKFIITGDSR